ncbi:MAG: hypothetical protein K6T57_14635 [Thermaceae bacterium]|nr:hypothetical protein [Thermaceae bacterium]
MTTWVGLAGNRRTLSKSDLQAALSVQFGSQLEVLDWHATGSDYVLQFRILPPSKPSSSSGDIVAQAFWVPLVITILAITGAIYAAYRLTVEVKAAAQLVPAPVRDVAVGGVGVGMAGLGIGAVLLSWWLLRRR